MSLANVTLDHQLIRIERASGNIEFIGVLPDTIPHSHGEFYGVVTDNDFVFVVDAGTHVRRFNLNQLK